MTIRLKILEPISLSIIHIKIGQPDGIPNDYVIRTKRTRWIKKLNQPWSIL
jgi:hypothetical protein